MGRTVTIWAVLMLLGTVPACDSDTEQVRHGEGRAGVSSGENPVTDPGRDQRSDLQQDPKEGSQEIPGAAANDTDPMPLRGLVTASKVDDPRHDGWETEAFNKQAKEQFKKLARLLQDPAKLKTKSVAGLLVEDFTCGQLRPTQLSLRFADDTTTIHTAPPGSAEVDTHRGAEGLVTALGELLEPFAGATDRRVDIKIFRVIPQGPSTTTREHFTLSAQLDDRSLEVHATWESTWTGGTQKPRLKSINLLQYEQAQVQTADKRLFADCTVATLGHNKIFKSQLMHGSFHWVGHIERALGPDINGFSGLAIGDVNGDGLDDLYVCETGGLPNRLFVQNPDGTATDVSRQAGVDFADFTLSALLVDLDNDGDQDMALCTDRGIAVLSNDGTGRFQTRRTTGSIKMGYSLSAADYDQDGDLDLYVCKYDPGFVESGDVPQAIPYHDANNGAANHLLRNDGDFKFADVTVQSGLDIDNRRFSFAAAWEDYDNDGDQDLYVANDFGRNCLYRNDDGQFVNVAPNAGVEDIASGMSVSWSDCNHDGHMDVYVGNMYSAAGNRVTTQGHFQPEFSSAAKAHVQRLARGNSLFINSGKSTFFDKSIEAGVNMGRWAWSSLFTDFNNDGWDDLVVANGYMTGSDPDDL